MYAVVRTGGKQYRVQPGQQIRVERLPGEPGEALELTDVLLLERDGTVTVGSPLVENARVLTEILAQGRDRKIRVFKYKSKVRYRRLTGHRQRHTLLAVKEIVEPGRKPAATRSRRRRSPTPGDPAPTAAEPAPEGAPSASSARAQSERTPAKDAAEAAAAAAPPDSAEAAPSARSARADKLQPAEPETATPPKPRPSRARRRPAPAEPEEA